MVDHELHSGRHPSPFYHPVVPADRLLHNFLAVSELLYALLSAQETAHREGRPCSVHCGELPLEYQKVDRVHLVEPGFRGHLENH
jgi:hypothetical protein